jgi:lysozyme family protein
MSQFEPAVEITLKREGGFVDNPDDKGGPTNMGITQEDMPGVNLKTLTVQQATFYYEDHFWSPVLELIQSQNVCNKIFDMGVVFGRETATRLAQVVLGLPAPYGVFGPETMSALNAHDPAAFLSAYKSRLEVHARWILTQDPTQEQFVNGWVNRINS